MAITIIKTVGVGQDCADLAAFHALTPASLVAADQQWVAHIVGEVVAAGTQVLAARTTDATRNIIIMAKPTTGFRDHASKLTNPLFYDATKGSALSCSVAFDDAFVFASAFTEVRGLQIISTSGSAYKCVVFNGANCTIADCILQNAAGGDLLFIGGGSATVKNVLGYRAIGGNGISCDFGGGSTVTNNTVVSAAGSGTGVSSQVTGNIVTDCALFGFATPLHANMSASSSNNASDVAIGIGTANQASLVQANQFVGANDFRPKSGAALINNGIAVAGRTTDILGQTVSATPTIGAMEFSAGGTSVSRDLPIAYSVLAAGSVSSDLAVSYTVIGTVSSDRTIAYAVAAATGSISSEAAENNAGTAYTTETVNYSWFPGGRTGSMGGITPIEGTKALVAGVLTLTGLPLGAGKLEFQVRGATVSVDAEYVQYLTAA